MLNDIDIARKIKLKPIKEIAYNIGLDEKYVEEYGRFKAKINLKAFDDLKGNPDGKLIYVTAITPTPAGEGKTCTAVGVTQALGKIGKKVMLCLREPSMGPVFGIKGGATGGGYSQVLPMEDINLHFTGDIHAVAAAANLLAAIVDNHIVNGNELNIDPIRIFVRRALDVNDRQLRNVVTGLGGKSDGYPRQSGFDITAASEVMAILCLCADLTDLKKRLGDMLIALTYDKQPVYARDLKVEGALAMILKDAIKPNLVQTIEGQPAFIHGGPFANIAHGNNSVIATKMALKVADYVVTEGGFAADLGAEKFFDIVSPVTGIKPDVAVLVVSARALKCHAESSPEALDKDELAVLRSGFANMDVHIENLTKKFGLPVVVAINRFPSDTTEELECIKNHCFDMGIKAAVSEVVARGGEGGIDLGEKILEALNDQNSFASLYSSDMPIKDKIDKIAKEIYRADGVTYSKEARKSIDLLSQMGYGSLPVCIAKTQMSLSDDPALKGAPRGFKLNVREIKVSAGAGFIVAVTGTIMTMPGLPKRPAAENIDIDADGNISGLF